MNESTADISSFLATYLGSLSPERVPSEALTLAERSMIDTIGVALAGTAEDPAELTVELVRLHGGRGSSPIFGSDLTSSSLDAALVHGTAAHSLDFDDTSTGINGHPSAAMIPALLSGAENERVSGLEILTAYVAGFEAQCLIAAPILDSHYRAGWHTTATIGTFGATAATAKLLGLNASEITHALNIAASLTAGLKQNFGSMTKSLHAGHAARCGLTATLLAQSGFTAGDSALGGESGFLDLYGGDTVTDSSAYRPADGRWFIQEKGIHLKKYPCCHYTHAAIEETIRLVVDNDLRPDEIDRIHVTGSPGAADAANIDRPETGLEGKFSISFLIACAVVYREIHLDSFDRETLFDDRVRDLMERVTFDVNRDWSYGSLSADVRIQTHDGVCHTVEKALAPGLYGINPLSDEELQEKFLMCSTTVLDEPTADELWGLLYELRHVDDFAEVREVLS